MSNCGVAILLRMTWSGPKGMRPVPLMRAGSDEPLSVFESGAILVYLAEKSGKFLPADLRGRSEVLQWLMWQMGGLGPMLGQHGHFHLYAPERIRYAIDRYRTEAERLYGVLMFYREICFLIFWSLAPPIPRTFAISSGFSNRPCSSRYCTIRSANAGPIPRTA